ncbi:hypothetical protein C5167_002660 [Papaver somniferum]|uniref:Uncharacterized protein n=1 Tax=Papaver somniferum TaxID=3469 RepID=A0A4Y7KTL5_PAPSO|nr:cation/H(+) antiporter 15-like [Papaver somniferum]RZC76127.1 hypothetical protein C5167_002660 [Papaver somniferum]
MSASDWTIHDPKMDNVGNRSVILYNGTALDYTLVCYEANRITQSGVWKGDNPLEYAVPLFILQLVLVVLTTRLVDVLLKPFGQPRVVANILGGIILGPSGLGRIDKYAAMIFPIRSILVLQTMANMGVLFSLFSVGVQMDLSVVRRTGKKSLVFAVAGMGLPFIIAAASSPKLMHRYPAKQIGPIDYGIFILFFGVALSVTAFTVIARFLAELKLLSAELGRLAMSSAIVNDLLAWILLSVGIILARFQQNVNNLGHDDSRQEILTDAVWVTLSSIAFVVFCIFLIKPGIKWVIKRTSGGENVSDFYLCLILTGVMICGFVTDSIGTHAFFGALLFGLVIPNGPLASNLIDSLEDFVSNLLLPLFFAVCGLRTNIRSMTYSANWFWLFMVTILCNLAKIGAIFCAGFFHKMPHSEGVALGLLMNIKGLNEMIVLNIARELKVFKEETIALLVIVALVSTAVIIPTITALYKSGGRFVPNKRRTIQKSKPDAELRLLTCIHSTRNIPAITKLLDISHPNKRSPIHVYALQLVELRGLASAMLIVHNSRKSGRPPPNRTQAQSDQIVNAFETYEKNAASVSVEHLTAISPYSTMHEDICNLAEDKKVSLLVVPFHKQQTIDGGMEEPNPDFRTLNQNVLANAPCSVGILVDRGLGAASRAQNARATHDIVVLFFGGADDREALAYAMRMSDCSDVNLTVLRFIPGEETKGWSKRHDNDSSDNEMLTVLTDSDRDRQMDEDIICDFRMKTSNDESVVYIEKITNNGEETVSVIRSLDNVHDLYIVGRGQGIVSPLTDGLTDWSECPELGVIGDILASPDFAASVSVLVVQQYVGMGLHGDGTSSTDSPAQQQPAEQPFEQPSFRGPTNNYDGHGKQPWQQVHRR